MLKKFRIISVIEGISLITLLFIAMPAKYQFGYGGLVPIVGMAHGLLWLLYMVTSLGVSHQQKWSVLYWLFVCLLSVIPFGFLILDWQLKKHIQSLSPVETLVE